MINEINIGFTTREMRKKANLTQCELSEKTGIAQCDISRIESGRANPSIKTISRLAAGMDLKIKIEFVKVK